MPSGEDMRRAMGNPAYRGVASWVARRLMLKSSPSDPGVPFDYSTLEYTVSRKTLSRKWECVRGIGRSFGYTANGPESNFMSPAEGIRLLADVVSSNGNLLLNVDPNPGGAIQDVQMACIRGIGDWLAGSGEAIYGTQPWIRPAAGPPTAHRCASRRRGPISSPSSPKLPPRRGGDAVRRSLPSDATVSLVQSAAPIPAAVRGRDLEVRLPQGLGGMPVALKIVGGTGTAGARSSRCVPNGRPAQSAEDRERPGP